MPLSPRVSRPNPNAIRPNTVVKVHGCFGLGDTLYLRPVVELWAATRGPGTTHVHTPWPQLWDGTPVRIIPSNTHLRTQIENERRNAHLYTHHEPANSRRLPMGYNIAEFERGRTVTEAIASRLQLTLPDKIQHAFAVPDGWKWKPTSDKPIAFVRPPTVRKEWRAPGRNPDPVAFKAIVSRLMETHHVVSVAKVEKNDEWIVDEIPAHERFEHGELTTEQAFGLMASSDIAIGGVGFIVPASAAANVPTFILAGGVLKGNDEHALCDKRLDWNIRFAYPDIGSQCWCTKYEHACVKRTDPARVVQELESFLSEAK